MSASDSPTSHSQPREAAPGLSRATNRARRRVIDGRGIPLVSTYLKTPRSEIKRAAEAVDQMADDMRLLAARNGDVTESDLSLIGWKLAQIRKHGTAARERACELERAA